MGLYKVFACEIVGVLLVYLGEEVHAHCVYSVDVF